MHSIFYSAFYFASLVLSEGYYCPYTDLGSNGNNQLLYDYYNANGNYWTRNGETGWQTVESYCRAKGDLNQHSDAGEWKCNDSHGLCFWDGSNCNINTGREPDCKELCQAVIDNKGPNCLGNCPDGQQSNFLYSQYCQPQQSEPQQQEPRQQEPQQQESRQQEPKQRRKNGSKKERKKIDKNRRKGRINRTTSCGS